jgi:hypothetical protein
VRVEINHRNKSTDYWAFTKSINGTVNVVFEEGAQATWLYDLMHALDDEAYCDTNYEWNQRSLHCFILVF